MCLFVVLSEGQGVVGDAGGREGLNSHSQQWKMSEA